MIVWTKNNYCSETIMHAGIDRNRERERERERERTRNSFGIECRNTLFSVFNS